MKNEKSGAKRISNMLEATSALQRQDLEDYTIAPFVTQIRVGNDWTTVGAFFDYQAASDNLRRLLEAKGAHEVRIVELASPSDELTEAVDASIATDPTADNPDGARAAPEGRVDNLRIPARRSGTISEYYPLPDGRAKRRWGRWISRRLVTGTLLLLALMFATSILLRESGQTVASQGAAADPVQGLETRSDYSGGLFTQVSLNTASRERESLSSAPAETTWDLSARPMKLVRTADGHSRLVFDGRTVRESRNPMHLRTIVRQGFHQVAIIEVETGSGSCPTEAILFAVNSRGEIQSEGPFGGCDTSFFVTTLDDRLVIAFPQPHYQPMHMYVWNWGEEPRRVNGIALTR